MRASVWGAWLLCSCFAFGQQTPEKPSFEVASIKPAEPAPTGQLRIRMSADAGMLRYSNVSLKDCIRVAYRVKDFQIQGPSWMESARFDVEAKLPDGSSKGEIPEMLQTLLADRFKLTLHRETKEHAIYALVAGKDGPKLKPADISEPDKAALDKAALKENPGKGAIPRGAMLVRMDSAGMHLKAPAASLANVAEMLSRFAERPIIDMTHIQGEYDFDLAFSPRVMRGMPGSKVMPPHGGEERPPAEAAAPEEAAGSIFDAVQRYGLKLDARKAPIEMLIVDHVERTPTEN